MITIDLDRTMRKSKTIEEFLSLLQDMNCNKVDSDHGYEEVFGKDMPFSMVCNKCASTDIELIGERGRDWGGQTGADADSTVVKCNGCGNAITVHG